MTKSSKHFCRVSVVYHLRKKIKKTIEKKVDKSKIEEIGPFLIKQQEKFAEIENTLDPKVQEEFLQKIRSIRPEIKADIQQKINELKNIIERYNPIHLLHYICTRHSFYDPETYKESETKSMEIWIEYALSFITSVEPNHSIEDPTTDVFTRFEELIKNIIHLCRQYYMTEGANISIDTNMKLVRFQFIIRYLGFRGDSYENHHKELVLQTFQPHDAFLEENYGFSTNEIIEFIDNILAEVKNNLKPYKNQRDFVLKFQEIAKKHKLEKGDKSDNITEGDLKEFNNNEEMKALRKEYNKYLENLEKFYFKLNPREKLPKALLELFSIAIGENTPFQERDAFWPLNDSIIYFKPIIKYNNEYFGFGSSIFFRNILTILEELIQTADQDYYINKFIKKKAKVLEELSLKFLNNIMPNAQVYRDLYYYNEIEGEQRQYETDGLIIYDENIFIIEAKAHKFTISARRGSLKRIEKTSKKVIDDAYNQAIRCKNFILENPLAKFFGKNGRNVLSINSKNYRSIYLINTTYENLSHLSTQLHELKAFNLIDGKEWPWTVFINDLRIISEIVESSSTFILYLQRRILMNEKKLIMTSDELDYFMFFLKKGLYFEDIKLSEKLKLSLIGLTDELDRYYLFLSGYISKVERPKFNIPEEYKKIDKILENSGKRGFTLATIALLGLDSRDHKQFLKFLPKYKEVSYKTDKDLKMFFHYKKPKRGLLFVIRTIKNNKNWTDFRDFLELMMYKYKLTQGIMYKCVYKARSSDIPSVTFEIIEKEWKFDLKMHRRAKKFNFKGMRKIQG